MNFRKIALASALIARLAQTGFAEEAFYRLPITSLTFTEGTLPARPELSNSRRWQIVPAFEPYAILDGPGEVYIGGESLQRWNLPNSLYENAIIAIRAEKGKDVAGRLFVPKADFTGMTALNFKVVAENAKTESMVEFLKAKENHYRRLLDRSIPGTAWFRHQEREAVKARGGKVVDRLDNSNRVNRSPPFEPEDTYEMFSGGRALSENLQLDRLLPLTGPGTNTIDITNLAGITIHEMDWKALIKDLKPQPDPLAAYVPFDQHALFFPTFSAMTEMMDEADADGTPVLQMLEPRSEDANSRGRYQKQLCLELSEISRLLGPQVINSVAFTGSDPYLPSGTDVGVLFETKQPAVLKAFIAARQMAMKQTNPAVKAVNGEIEGVAYSGVVSPDRSVCSYVAGLEQVVLVSNSLYQLGCLAKTAKGKKPALASQDEYVFFRNRYRRGDRDETAFLILTDATIRRWSSPQWRIANSRRTKVASALAELQARHLDELVGGKVKPGPIQTDLSLPDAGEIQMTSGGVASWAFGTLDFLTPIAEIPLAKVTQAEADAYNRWRNGYQQNWRQFFDPIAVRFSVTARRLSAEVTVMPLIGGTDYRQFINVTSGSRITPGSGDPHPEALLHLAMAINTQSETIQQAGNFLASINPSLKANPLGWLGESIAIYADQDPFWDKLSKADKSEKFLEENYHRLPLALHCEVKNPLGLAAFLAALRAYVEQTAPKMTVWQNSEYNGQAYVKITSTQTGDAGALQNLAIYYAATPRSFVLTLNEPLLKRALDRQSARETAKADGPPAAAPHKPWLGTNLCLQVDTQFLGAFHALTRDSYESAQQLLSWNNLPILNEWKRLYPSQDPVKLHEQFWQTKLICPGGGAYVWNETWQTMESTVYGHPGQPKAGPGKILPLAKVTGANLGVTFENQGLSAKAVLNRETGKQ